MTPDAGPSGLASPPPPDLAAHALKLTTVRATESFVRIHWTRNAPIFFSPGSGHPPAGRFDSAAGRFGVLYVAQTLDGAFAETVLRNPARKLVSADEIRGRSMAVLGASRALRLVPMHGPGLQALGLDNAITTGPYSPCGQWSDSLFDHPDAPDGIAYASRHDPEQLCIALFEKPDVVISPASDSISLIELQSEVAAILRKYGKGLAP